MTDIEAGMSLKERNAARAELRRHVLLRVQAEYQHVKRSMVCTGQGVMQDHSRCVAEKPGGMGCLCECHDQEAEE